MLQLGAPTLAAYARRWGWDLVISTENMSEGRPVPWAKLRLLQRLLVRYETVLWVDADALFVSMDRDIEADPGATADVAVVRHPLSWHVVPVPNTGVILVRRSDWSHEFLNRCWHEARFIHHRWWENAAFLSLLGYEFDEERVIGMRPTPEFDRVGFLDLAWNSLPGFCEADNPSVNHYTTAAGDFELRLTSMAADLERSVDRYPSAFVQESTAGSKAAMINRAVLSKQRNLSGRLVAWLHRGQT